MATATIALEVDADTARASSVSAPAPRARTAIDDASTSRFIGASPCSIGTDEQIRARGECDHAKAVVVGRAAGVGGERRLRGRCGARSRLHRLDATMLPSSAFDQSLPETRT